MENIGKKSKDMEIKGGKCFLEASSTATNKNHTPIHFILNMRLNFIWR